MSTTHLVPLAAPTSRIDPLLAELSGLAKPFGDAHHLGTLRLPAYAMDGRALQWNQDKTAVAFDATESEYFSDVIAASSSMLRKIDRSPAHARAAALMSAPELPSQRIGRAVHCAVLEPQRFASDYVRWTGHRRGSRWTQFADKNQDKEILDPREWDIVEGCTESIRSALLTTAGGQCTVADLISASKTECVVYWLDKVTGITCKARFDILAQRAVADLKTTDDARDGPFVHQCAKQGYHLQAAHYLAGEQALLDAPSQAPFLLIAAELSAPHCAVVYPVDPEHFVAPGEQCRRQALATMLECVKSNRWPGYAPAAAPLRLPLHHRFPDQTLNI